MIDVLVDMTALNTGSRERGIGRYVRSLCLALAARESWLPKYPGLLGAQLSVSGLVRHLGKAEGAEIRPCCSPATTASRPPARATSGTRSSGACSWAACSSA